MRLIERARPDVIVSTYPNMTEVLGRLRRSGRLRDAGVRGDHRSRGARLLGEPGGRRAPRDASRSRSPRCGASRAQRPRSTACTASRTPPSGCRARARMRRAALDLPADGKIVLVSGGGWGVGDVLGAVAGDVAPRAGVGGRLPVRLQRRPLPPGRRALRRRSARARRGLHRSHARVDGGERRARALDVRPDRSRGASCAGCPASRTDGVAGTSAERRGAAPLRPRRGRGDARRARGARSSVPWRGHGDRTRASPTCRRRPRSCWRSRTGTARTAGAEHVRGAPVVAAGALGAAAAWCWPAPLPLAPSLAERLGVPCRLAQPHGIALTFDDGPHPVGHACDAESCSRGRARRRRSSSSASRWSAGRRSPPRSLRQDTRSACTATATGSCCGAARAHSGTTSRPRST